MLSGCHQFSKFGSRLFCCSGLVVGRQRGVTLPILKCQSGEKVVQQQRISYLLLRPTMGRQTQKGTRHWCRERALSVKVEKPIWTISIHCNELAFRRDPLGRNAHNSHTPGREQEIKGVFHPTPYSCHSLLLHRHN